MTNMKKKNLYLQIIGGISGDMYLSLMGDLGIDLKELEYIISKVVPVEICFQKRRTKGISGTVVDIKFDKNQKIRRLNDLIEIIDRLDVSSNVKNRAKGALKKLAEIEAQVHGISIDEVHFHEIGAVDTLVDVVGCFFCLEKLEISSVFCSKIPLFEGMIQCEHGKLPLPAPATLRLLKGKPVYFTNEQKELITPTGALILDTIVDFFDIKPSGVLISDGYGIGHMELQVPNVVRGIIIEQKEDKDNYFEEQEICVLETNVDHLTAEEIGNIIQIIINNGALDVFYLPGIGKKNRPSGILQVMCFQYMLNSMLDLLFKYTMTLGIRINKVKRVVLNRASTTFNTNIYNINIKEFNYKNSTYKRPEFESIREFAEKTGKSPIEIRLKLMEHGLKYFKKEDDKMEYREKLIKRLQHWLEHNEKHMEEYKKIAEELKTEGLDNVASYILNLVEHTKNMNKEIENALNEL